MLKYDLQPMSCGMEAAARSLAPRPAQKIGRGGAQGEDYSEQPEPLLGIGFQPTATKKLHLKTRPCVGAIACFCNCYLSAITIEQIAEATQDTALFFAVEATTVA